MHLAFLLPSICTPLTYSVDSIHGTVYKQVTCENETVWWGRAIKRISVQMRQSGWHGPEIAIIYKLQPMIGCFNVHEILNTAKALAHVSSDYWTNNGIYMQLSQLDALRQSKEAINQVVAGKRKQLDDVQQELSAVKAKAKSVFSLLNLKSTTRAESQETIANANAFPAPLFVLFHQGTAVKEAFDSRIDLAIQGTLSPPNRRINQTRCRVHW